MTGPSHTSGGEDPVGPCPASLTAPEDRFLQVASPGEAAVFPSFGVFIPRLSPARCPDGHRCSREGACLPAHSPGLRRLLPSSAIVTSGSCVRKPHDKDEKQPRAAARAGVRGAGPTPPALTCRVTGTAFPFSGSLSAPYCSSTPAMHPAPRTGPDTQ